MEEVEVRAAVLLLLWSGPGRPRTPGTILETSLESRFLQVWTWRSSEETGQQSELPPPTSVSWKSLRVCVCACVYVC